jgi:HlyD family secretion protein
MIGPRYPGRIEWLGADRGDTVAAGAVVARLHAEETEAQFRAAEADARAAALAVEAARAGHDAAEAALVRARADLARRQHLARTGHAAPAEFDLALAAARQAEAEAAAARDGIARAAAQARSAAEASRAAAARLDDTLLRAPFAGLLVARERGLGETVPAGGTVFQIVDPATIVAVARFDESAMAAVAPGQPARLRFASDPSTPVAGRVMRLGRLVDRETREFTLDIRPLALPANWAMEQRMLAEVEAAPRQGVLAIPVDWIVRREGRAGVWVAEAGRARWRRIALGAAGDGRVEVTAGLAAGARVLAPQAAWRGMRVAAP